VQLKPGEHAESFKIQSLEGLAGEFTYSDPGKKYLLFIFSTTCSHCENTMVYWQHIAENGNDGRCNIAGLSMDTPGETKKYAAQKKLNFPVVSIADSGFGKKYKISGVPTTVLVRGDGLVEQSWYGELSSAQSDDIENMMKAN
jgi:peroxiredoxin